MQSETAGFTPVQPPGELNEMHRLWLWTICFIIWKTLRYP